MTRAAVYARVSTKEQSTEAQVGQLTAYCQARGWPDVAVFRDDGISGVRTTGQSSIDFGSGSPRGNSMQS